METNYIYQANLPLTYAPKLIKMPQQKMVPTLVTHKFTIMRVTNASGET